MVIVYEYFYPYSLVNSSDNTVEESRLLNSLPSVENNNLGSKHFMFIRPPFSQFPELLPLLFQDY